MNHSFDVAVANVVGVNAAVLFQSIAFWCQHCEANGKNFHDGLYWTYSSNKAFREIFTYMSASQIDTALRKLLDHGLIVKGNYNKSAYDRTMWYAVTEKGKSIFGKSKMEKRNSENQNPGNRDPIPVTITDAVEDSITDTAPKRADADKGDSTFTQFWKLYPRRVAKQTALRAWKKAGAESLADTILADVRRRLDGEWKGRDVQYIPHPASYLNQRRWEDEPLAEPEEEKREGLWWEGLSLQERRRLEEEQAARDREILFGKGG